VCLNLSFNKKLGDVRGKGFFDIPSLWTKYLLVMGSQLRWSLLPEGYNSDPRSVRDGLFLNLFLSPQQTLFGSGS
jgi:hypothetical protein